MPYTTRCPLPKAANMHDIANMYDFNTMVSEGTCCPDLLLAPAVVSSNLVGSQAGNSSLV